MTEHRDVERELSLARFPETNPGSARMDVTSVVLLSNAAVQQVFGLGLRGRSWLVIRGGVRSVRQPFSHHRSARRINSRLILGQRLASPFGCVRLDRRQYPMSARR